MIGSRYFLALPIRAGARSVRPPGQKSSASKSKIGSGSRGADPFGCVVTGSPRRSVAPDAGGSAGDAGGPGSIVPGASAGRSPGTGSGDRLLGIGFAGVFTARRAVLLPARAGKSTARWRFNSDVDSPARGSRYRFVPPGPFRRSTIRTPAASKASMCGNTFDGSPMPTSSAIRRMPGQDSPVLPSRSAMVAHTSFAVAVMSRRSRMARGMRT